MQRQIIVILVILWGLGGSSLLGAMERSVARGDTAVIDTLKLLSDQPLKSPTGAMLRSAVLPGWGQVYNHQYAKAVLVFGVNALLLQRVVYYHRQWRSTRIRAYQEKRNTFTWYLGLAYVLTIVDAYVDAYLFEFDTAMDISGFIPQSVPSSTGWVGMRISIHF
ncbi:MAG: hypothetical protein GXO78_13490 [Calditrichaeota bacterium]|nr:hypothetical protein [Calditrichota bacterium]